MPTRSKPSFPQLNRSHPLAQGMLVCLPFFEGSGLTTSELIGQSTASLVSTVSWAPREAGNTISFPGSATSYIAIRGTKILAGLKNFAISFVFRSTGNAAVGSPFYCERAASGNDILKLELSPSGFMRFTFRDDAGTLNQPTGSINWSDSTMHHVVLSKAGTALNIYVDAVLDVTSTLTVSDTLTDAVSSRCGSDPVDVSTSSVAGNGYQLLLWNRALSLQDVEQLTADPYGIYRKKSWGLKVAVAASAIARRTFSFPGTRIGSRRIQ